MLATMSRASSPWALTRLLMRSRASRSYRCCSAANACSSIWTAPDPCQKPPSLSPGSPQQWVCAIAQGGGQPEYRNLRRVMRVTVHRYAYPPPATRIVAQSTETLTLRHR